MSDKKVITVGSDPEIFVKDNRGCITSVAGHLGCDKWNQRDLGNGIFLQEDNVLVEFATNPTEGFKEFSNIIKLGIDCCEEEVGKLDLSLAKGVSSHVYTMDELNSFNKSVFEFGCEPDFNALTGRKNPKPQAADPGLRTAGGHVHIGYAQHIKGMSLEESQSIVGVMCDYFLGLPAMLIDPDDRRRELYGKAGAVRYKKYGIEYRTLSNFWMFSDENHKFIWEQVQKAHEHLYGAYERLITIVEPEEIQNIINTNDKKAAEKYVKLLKVA